MTKYFVARAKEGTEYTFTMSGSIAGGTKARAEKLARILNEYKHNLKPGEIWYVYENDYYYNIRIEQQARISKSKISFSAYRDY